MLLGGRGQGQKVRESGCCRGELHQKPKGATRRYQGSGAEPPSSQLWRRLTDTEISICNKEVRRQVSSLPRNAPWPPDCFLWGQIHAPVRHIQGGRSVRWWLRGEVGGDWMKPRGRWASEPLCVVLVPRRGRRPPVCSRARQHCGWLQWEARAGPGERHQGVGDRGANSSSGALADPASKAAREPEGTGPQPERNSGGNEHFTFTLKRRIMDPHQVLSVC